MGASHYFCLLSSFFLLSVLFCLCTYSLISSVCSCRSLTFPPHHSHCHQLCHMPLYSFHSFCHSLALCSSCHPHPLSFPHTPSGSSACEEITMRCASDLLQPLVKLSDLLLLDTPICQQTSSVIHISWATLRPFCISTVVRENTTFHGVSCCLIGRDKVIWFMFHSI